MPFPDTNRRQLGVTCDKEGAIGKMLMQSVYGHLTTSKVLVIVSPSAETLLEASHSW